MLELRLTLDGKRLAAMRDAIVRECERSKAGAEHGAAVVRVVEQLVGASEPRRGRPRRVRGACDVFVIVTVQSDATMLIVRDARPELGGLGERRQQVLEEHTSSWSTMSGRDGRTIWAEIPRVVATRAPSDEESRPVPPTDIRESVALRREAQPVATRT
jgi:hypothetical protein